MMLVSIKSLTHDVKGTLVAMTLGDYRCRFEGKFKTLRSLPFRHGIELDFFHNCRIIGLTLENLNSQKWAPSDFSKKFLIIVHKVAFVSVKSCNSVEDVRVHPCSEMS